MFDEQGKWKPGRLLNGDQTHQGRHIRLPPGQFQIQKVRFYRYFTLASMSGTRETLALRGVAAGRHVAPDAAATLRGIDEQPAAVMPAAHARAIGVEFTQQVHRGKHHEVERKVETAALADGFESQPSVTRCKSAARRSALPGGLDLVERRGGRRSLRQQGNTGVVQCLAYAARARQRHNGFACRAFTL